MKNDKFYDIIDDEIEKLSVTFKDNEHLKKQDGNGKKSFLFLIWFLHRYLPNIDLNGLEEFITEGNDDSSCDLIFTNHDQFGVDVYYVVQAKWFAKNNIDGTNKITKEIKACLSDFKLILSGKKNSDKNSNFNTQYDKFLNHKRSNGKIKFIFLALCNGEVEINEHIEDFISNLVSFELIDFFKLKEQYIEIEYKGVKTHNPIETPYIPKSKFILKFEEKQFISIQNPFQSNIFLIRPSEVYNMFETYGHSLFYKNIRNPLSLSLFNKQIKDTIQRNPINFWYFNNGVTAITDNIEQFHNDASQVTISGIQVINGAQTVYNIYDAYKYATDNERKIMNENALITFRIVKSGGNDFDLQVTRYTNSQNPISERDFHSNDEVQKRIQHDFFKHTNVWYETRRGEFPKKNIKDVLHLTNEQLGQLYLAYSLNDPFNAKQSKKLLFLSKNIQPNGLYETVFNENTQYDEMLLSYHLNLLIDRNRKIYKVKISNIDTNNLSENENRLLKFDFIQYSNFEILALFKILLQYANKQNKASINGKSLSNFENSKLNIFEKYYEYITNFIADDLIERKSIDSKIVNSVLFKSIDYYSNLKASFKNKIENDSEINKLKL